jgi:signal peptide peptidase SppA
MDKLLFELLSRSPLWAILNRGLLVHLRHLHLGLNVTAGMDAATFEATKPYTLGSGELKTTIIPVQGVLTKDGPSYYGSSYDGITTALDAAGSDKNVKRIVLAVDSPGGEVNGLPETAAVLSQVAKVKPVSAIVEGTSASAAYWLTSQAHDITLTPSGEVGSVGVRMMHVDISKMLGDMGYKVTELYSGDFKTEWSPYKPLTEEAVSDMQPRLNTVHQDFINAVAGGRGNRASAEIASKRFGEGRMFSAKDALTHGLVDKLLSSNDFYKAIAPAAEETPVPAFGFNHHAQALVTLADIAGRRVLSS